MVRIIPTSHMYSMLFRDQHAKHPEHTELVLCCRAAPALSDLSALSNRSKGLSNMLAGVMQQVMLPSVLEMLSSSPCVCDGDLLTLDGLSAMESGLCYKLLRYVVLVLVCIAIRSRSMPLKRCSVSGVLD